MTHLQHARATQPPDIPSKRCNRVIGPIRRCERIKFIPKNISRKCRKKGTYQRPHQAIRLSPPAQRRVRDVEYGADGPTMAKRQCREPKRQPTSVSCKRQGQSTHLGHHQPMYPSPLALIRTQRFISGAGQPSVRKR